MKPPSSFLTLSTSRPSQPRPPLDRLLSYSTHSTGTNFNLLPTGSEEREVLGMGSIPVALLPTGSEEGEVFGVGSICVAILPSCQDIKTIPFKLPKDKYRWVVNIRNTSEAVKPVQAEYFDEATIFFSDILSPDHPWTGY